MILAVVSPSSRHEMSRGSDLHGGWEIPSAPSYYGHAQAAFHLGRRELLRSIDMDELAKGEMKVLIYTWGGERVTGTPPSW